MKTFIYTLAILISHVTIAQMEEGAYTFGDTQIELLLRISDGGWTISSATITNNSTNKIQTGTGEFRRTNGQEWYEFQTADCNYSFSTSSTSENMLMLEQFDCKNGKPSTKFNLVQQSDSKTSRSEMAIDHSPLSGSAINETPNNVRIIQQKVGKLSCKTIISADKGESLISLAYSKENTLLFIGTTKGKMIVVNDKDSVIKTLRFPYLCTVDLDYNGKIGAFTVSNGSPIENKTTVYFFNQKTLELLDSISISYKQQQGAFKVWFAKSGIFISSLMNVYKKSQDRQIVEVVAPSYSILDYDYATDQFVLGYWDKAIHGDRKVKKVFTCRASNMDEKRHVFTTERSFELYTYLIEKAKAIVSYDGKGNYYRYDLSTNQKATTIQDTIKEVRKKNYGLTKLDENTLMVVKYNPLPITAESIKKYSLSLTDHPTEFIFKESKTGSVIRSLILMQGLSNNHIVVNETSKSFYYLTSGSSGNQLLRFK